MTKVRVVEIERKAGEKYQRILKRILKKYNFSTKGCFVYITKDKPFGINVHGLKRSDALKVCQEAMEEIDKLS